MNKTRTRKELYQFVLKDFIYRGEYVGLCTVYETLLQSDKINYTEYFILKNDLNKIKHRPRKKFYDSRGKEITNVLLEYKAVYYYWPIYDRKAREKYLRNKIRQYSEYVERYERITP